MKKIIALVTLFYGSVMPQSVPEHMVFIPAGAFLMGSNNDRDNEKPEHQVYVEAFYMDKYEVTVAQYRQFIDATSRQKPEHWDDQLQHPNRPVVHVCWNDANAYAQWAEKRLPTEAEWEYAARGGNTGIGGKPKYKYPWGDEASPSKANFGFGQNRGDWVDANRYLRNVGNYPSNGYGLFDMAGNVWEWCADWSDKDYYKSSPSRNPKGPATGTHRVFRGGSWYFAEYHMRCATRRGRPPTSRSNFIGFRCVQDVR